MPIEAPIFNDLDSPTITERIARFDYQTQFLSDIAAMRGHQDYQFLVEKGQEAIPVIVNRLQSQPSWSALALNEITNQDIIGLNSDSTKETGITAKQIRENSLTWAEAQSLIEIRDPKEKITIGMTLNSKLIQALINNPDSSKALAKDFFNPRTIIAMGSPNYPYDIRGNLMSEASGTIINFGNEIAIVRHARERIRNEENHSIFVAFEINKQNALAISVQENKKRNEIIDVSFLAGNAKPNTKEAAQLFSDIVDKFFPFTKHAKS